MSQDDRLLRLPEVVAMTGRARSSIRRDAEAGHFPRPVKIGVHSNRWWESEIRRWLKNLPRGMADMGSGDVWQA